MNTRRERSGVAVIAVTGQGAILGGEIISLLRAEDPDADVTLHVKAQWQADAPPDAETFDGSLKEVVSTVFPHAETLVFMLDVGATVRLVAPMLGSKRTDPAVICVDDAGQFVVPILGSQQTEAERLAETIADAIGATAVVSTASDAAGLPNLERIGVDQDWRVESSPEALKQATAAILAGEQPAVYFARGHRVTLPSDWPRVDSLEGLRGWSGPRIAVTDRLIDPGILESGGPLLVYRPRTLALGVGCSLKATPDEVEQLARTTLAEAGLAWGSIHTVATIDRRLTHPALVQLVWKADAAFFPVFTAEELSAVIEAPTPSDATARHVGTPGVCEPAAILGSGGGPLIVPKRTTASATVAVALRPTGSQQPGRLWLVEMGPGPLDLTTPRATRAIREAEVVIGNHAVLEMLTDLVAESRMRQYDLGQERERAADAIRLAQEGRRVAVVSSGDIGVCGMAGLVFELLHEEDEDGPAIEVEVVPGVTAASSASALLGAPLTRNYATISLSELLAPWEDTRQRLAAAAAGDLVIVLSTPVSEGRRQPFEDALAILRERRPPETPVGLVRDAYRRDEEVTLLPLGELTVDDVDMRTVVVIGCSQTEVLDGVMVTRHGHSVEVTL